MCNGVWLCHQEELVEPTFNYYISTVEESKAPFLKKDSAMYRDRLRLVSLETTIQMCPFAERFQKCDTSGTYCQIHNINPIMIGLITLNVKIICISMLCIAIQFTLFVQILYKHWMVSYVYVCWNLPRIPIKLHTSDTELVAEIARGYILSIRTWGSGDFLGALSSRPEAERREIVDKLFRRMEAQVRAELTLHRNDYLVAHIMMQKTCEW